MSAKYRPRKRGKFGNVKTVVDGMVFDSKREAACYRTLSLLQRAGRVRDLRTKCDACNFPLYVGCVLICTYVADFVYYDIEQQQRVVADAKGYRTREYVLKKKLMKAIHGIEVLEL